jgi:hypothetical protein
MQQCWSSGRAKPVSATSCANCCAHGWQVLRNGLLLWLLTKGNGSCFHSVDHTSATICADRRCRYIWVDFNEYDGEWRQGRMSGQGTFVWKTGERYDGEWKVREAAAVVAAAAQYALPADAVRVHCALARCFKNCTIQLPLQLLGACVCCVAA